MIKVSTATATSQEETINKNKGGKVPAKDATSTTTPTENNDGNNGPTLGGALKTVFSPGETFTNRQLLPRLPTFSEVGNALEKGATKTF
eukprot:5298359-Ditylum_brightwellii.AAC.1